MFSDFIKDQFHQKSNNLRWWVEEEEVEEKIQICEL